MIYDRYANGLTVSQLVTDSAGHMNSSRVQTCTRKAQQENVVTTAPMCCCQVDQAYFAVLKAQAVLTVAREKP